MHRRTLLIRICVAAAIIGMVGEHNGVAGDLCMTTLLRLLFQSASHVDAAASSSGPAARLPRPARVTSPSSDYRYALVRQSQTGNNLLSAIATVGTTAIVGAGDDVRLVDVAKPVAPRVLSSLNLGGQVMDIAVAGSSAYVAVSPGGWRIVDITDPTQPEITGTIAPIVPSGDGSGVVVHDALVYLVETSFVRVIDLTDRATLHVRGRVESDAILDVVDVEYVDGTVYVVTRQTIVVIDVSDPDHPTEAMRISGDTHWEGMTTRGVRAYVGAQRGGLYIFDISNPRHPQQTVVVPPISYATYRHPDAVGSYLFVPAATDGLLVFDISDQDRPVLMGSVATEGDAWRAKALGDDVVLLLDWGIGLDVVDTSAAAAPVVAASLDWPSSYVAVHIQGDVAFGVTEFRRILAYDISTPATPRLVGSLRMPKGAGAFSVAWLPALIVAVDSRNSLVYMVDARDPANMTVVTSLTIAKTNADVAPCGPYVSIGTRDGFTLLDVTDIRRPRVAGGFHGTGDAVTIEDAHRVVCDADVAYADVASDVYRLVAFDVRDPAHVVAAGGIPRDAEGMALRVRALAVTEGNLVAGTDRGLVFVDNTDYRKLSIRRVVYHAGAVDAIAKNGDQLVTAFSGVPEGLVVWDLFQPDDPKVVAIADTRVYEGDDTRFMSFNAVAADGDNVAAAEGSTGLVFWRRELAVPSDATATATVDSRRPTPTATPPPSRAALLIPTALRNQ